MTANNSHTKIKTKPVSHATPSTHVFNVHQRGITNVQNAILPIIGLQSRANANVYKDTMSTMTSVYFVKLKVVLYVRARPLVKNVQQTRGLILSQWMINNVDVRMEQDILMTGVIVNSVI